jgi:hypothetical protein
VVLCCVEWCGEGLGGAAWRSHCNTFIVVATATVIVIILLVFFSLSIDTLTGPLLQSNSLLLSSLLFFSSLPPSSSFPVSRHVLLEAPVEVGKLCSCSERDT